jgi:hypothetical protein
MDWNLSVTMETTNKSKTTMKRLFWKKQCLLAALLFAAAPACFAQTVLVQYNLTGATPLAPSTVASGVTAGNVTLGYSWFWSEATNGLQTNPGTVTNAVQAAAQGSGFYSYFTISSTTPMNLTSLTFNGGYGNFSSPAGFDLKTSVDGYASYLTSSVTTALPSFGSNSISLTGAQFQGLTNITFQLYPYTAAYGYETLKNLTLNGTFGNGLNAGNTTISANPTSIPANGTSTSTLTVQAKDGNGNNLTSSGGTVTLSTSAGSVGSVTDNGNGTYTATLTSSATPGTANITGTIAGTTIGHPTSVIFTGTLSAANTTISANPASIVANGVSTSTLTVQAKDGNGNNLTASAGTVTLSTSAGSLSSVTDNGNGTYTATLTSPTAVGTASITGTIAGGTIGNPTSVVFTAAPLSAANTTISANPASITANGTSTSTVTVQAKDANNNNYVTSGGTVTLSTSAGSLGSVTDNQNGTYTATLTSSTTAGTANITGTIAGTAIGHSTSVAFSPGPVSAAKTTISANPASITANGSSTSTLTVQARDANSNNLASSAGTVTLSTSAGSLGSVTDNGNGTYTATLTSSTNAGAASITGTIAGTAIGNPTSVIFTAPLAANVIVEYLFNSSTNPLAPTAFNPGIGSASSITLVPDYDWDWSTATVGQLQEDAGAFINPAEAAAGGQYASFTLTSTNPMILSSMTLGGAYGQFGNPAGWVVQTSVDNFGSILATEVFPTQYSTFTNQSIDLSAASFQGVTNITIRVCGYVNNAAAAIFFNNFTINGVLGQPVAASNTTISASPASITANGASTSTLTVQARDANNNIISSSRGIVTLSASDGSLGSVTDNQNGTYTAILTSSTTVGTAYITGTIAGAAIGVPTSVAFVPGPVSAANTVISANPVSIAANGVSTLTVTVQARDANNNNLTSSGGAMVLNTTSGSLSSVIDNGNGTYTATLTASTTVGLVNITGTIAGTTIGNPISVFFTGSLSAANTTISVNPSSIQADGVSTSTVTVQAKDADDNNIGFSIGTVTLNTSAGLLSSVTDNGNGTYSAILTASTTAGMAGITGTIAGGTIGHPSSVTFVPPLSAANTTISGNPSSIVANGTSTSTITVQARDVNNNAFGLNGGAVTLSTTAGTLSSVTNNGNGTYSATLTAPISTEATPATVEITGTIAGMAIGHPGIVGLTLNPVFLIMTNIESPAQGAQVSWNWFPGQYYSTLSSTNLVDWLQTEVGVTNQFVDTNTTGNPRKFYMVKEDINPNPLISMGKPTFGYSPDAYQSTSGIFNTYNSSWNAGYPTLANPAWIAIEIGQGPSRVMFQWNAGGNYDYVETDYGGPGNYALYTSSNSTTGADGTWTQVVSVTNNQYRTRAHSFAFTGMSWIKMVITAAPTTNSINGELNSLNGAAFSRMEVYDVSAAYSRGRIPEDTWFFMGDSITAFWVNRADTSGTPPLFTNDTTCSLPCFANWISYGDTNYFPSIVDAGIGGTTSDNGLVSLPQYLIDNPDYYYWALDYGANDAAGNTTNTATYQYNMQQMINMLLANGRMPVIPHINYACDGGHNGVPYFNAVIDELVATNHILAGPDVYSYFINHTNEYVDCLHPNALGMRDYNLLWAQAMFHLYPGTNDASTVAPPPALATLPF